MQDAVYEILGVGRFLLGEMLIFMHPVVRDTLPTSEKKPHCVSLHPRDRDRLSLAFRVAQP